MENSTAYDYRKEIRGCVLEYIQENNLELSLDEPYDLQEFLYDELWNKDEVTGNGSGGFLGYYSMRSDPNYWDYILDNHDLLKEAIEEFCVPATTVAEKFLDEDWAYFDCTIRCYLLGEVLSGLSEELCTKGDEIYG